MKGKRETGKNPTQVQATHLSAVFAPRRLPTTLPAQRQRTVGRNEHNQYSSNAECLNLDEMICLSWRYLWVEGWIERPPHVFREFFVLLPWTAAKQCTGEEMRNEGRQMKKSWADFLLGIEEKLTASTAWIIPRGSCNTVWNTMQSELDGNARTRTSNHQTSSHASSKDGGSTSASAKFVS